MTRTRRKVAQGIYRDQYGYEAQINVHHRRKTKRFPPTVPLQKIKAWRSQQAEALGISGDPPAARDSLSHDVERYLKTIQHLTSWKETRAHLRAWLVDHKHMSRWKLTPEQVRQAQNDWIADGVAPKTVNHRVAALYRLYRVLDGKRAQTPCDDVAPLSVPQNPPQAVSAKLVNAVVRNLKAHERTGQLRNAKSRARFMVLAACGVRPSELMRAQPDDVNVKDGWWRTRDGKGGHRPGGLPLTRDMRAAWRLFIAADAWGKYSTRDLARNLRAAGWPSGLRVYQLRHNVGIALAEQGADLADISAFLGHSRPLTTRSHYVPVTRGRMHAASQLLEDRFGWAEKREQKAGQHLKR